MRTPPLKKKDEKDQESRVNHLQYGEPLATASSSVLVSTDGHVTADDLDNLRHMLGVSDRCRKGYRNYFVAGGTDVASMERLRAAGFVFKNERYALSDAPCYHATVEGARAVGLKALPR